MAKYIYNPTLWKDQLVMVDQNNNVIYEKDTDGNIVFWTDQYGNIIIDPVSGKPIPKPRLIQAGTKHKASLENNQEEGILIAHERLDGHDNDILRIKIQLELDGKVPGNSGTFADTFEGEPTKLDRQKAKAVLKEPVSAGTTTLNVDSTTGLKAFTEVTIYDGTNHENVLITDVTSSTLEVIALQNDYVKGAVIARSISLIKNGLMTNNVWGTFSIEPIEVV